MNGENELNRTNGEAERIPSILIEDLHKAYGDKQVLKGLNLKVYPCELFGFIGRNGIGKSTTIDCMIGAKQFQSGRILIDGFDIAKQPLEAKKRFGYVASEPSCYEVMTGYDYLEFIAGIYKISEGEFIKNYTYLCGRLKLDIKELKNRISEYSHGMKQKLAIISALIHSPKVLILDEPFVGLDPKASFILKEIMKEFCNNGGCIFFSTHVLEVAEKICDKIGIIKGGKLMAYGKTNEVIGDKSLENIFMEMIDNE